MAYLIPLSWSSTLQQPINCSCLLKYIFLGPRGRLVQFKLIEGVVSSQGVISQRQRLACEDLPVFSAKKQIPNETHFSA